MWTAAHSCFRFLVPLFPRLVCSFQGQSSSVIQGQRNFESRSAEESLEIDCAKFEEKTVRLYLDFVHNIKQSHEEIEYNQLMKLISFLDDMGKTGHE